MESYYKRNYMRIATIIMLCFLFVSCQKEVSIETNLTTASTFDSIVGKWRYTHEYRLVTTMTDTTVIIDSVYSDHYDPFSYFEIKPDSSYKLWRSASRTLPMYGWGDGGHVVTVDNSLRYIRTSGEFYTTDDFATSTPYTTVGLSPRYRIKYLDSDSMVLFFRAQQGGQYWWWHDVYEK